MLKTGICPAHGNRQVEWIEGAYRCDECGEPCEVASTPISPPRADEPRRNCPGCGEPQTIIPMWNCANPDCDVDHLLSAPAASGTEMPEGLSENTKTKIHCARGGLEYAKEFDKKPWETDLALVELADRLIKAERARDTYKAVNDEDDEMMEELDRRIVDLEQDRQRLADRLQEVTEELKAAYRDRDDALGFYASSQDQLSAERERAERLQAQSRNLERQLADAYKQTSPEKSESQIPSHPTAGEG